MMQNVFFRAESEVTPANLGEAIQQAIEIEIATIPIYLNSYYSVNRVSNKAVVSGKVPLNAGHHKNWLISILGSYDSCGNSGYKSCSFGFDSAQTNTKIPGEGDNE